MPLFCHDSGHMPLKPQRERCVFTEPFLFAYPEQAALLLHPSVYFLF